jgi:natural product precursor
MKKIKLDGKLKLNKETIAKLNDGQMNDVKGGDTFTVINTRKGGACQTNEKSCLRKCGSWFNCNAGLD